MTVQIVEVIRRSEQGITQPYICRGDNDKVYFVKGVGAGRRSQLCEWIAGNLGLALDLPIAPFDIVEVPEELMGLNYALDLSDLGSGPAFGSQGQEVMELNVSAVDEVSELLQQDVFAFDWWIRNSDRFLTEKGGNPNLFWNPGDQELIVIDHNQAFDAAFNADDFNELHIFRSQRDRVFGDMSRHQDYNRRFSLALNNWSEICSNLPKEWFFADVEMTVPVSFSLEDTYNLLEEYKKDGFWTIP